MISQEVGIVVLLLCVFVSRIVTMRATKAMSPESKAEMVDKFSGFTAYGMIPLVVIVLACFLLVRYTGVDTGLLAWGYFGLLIATIVGSQFYLVRKLKEMDLDSSYLRQVYLC